MELFQPPWNVANAISDIREVMMFLQSHGISTLFGSELNFGCRLHYLSGIYEVDCGNHGILSSTPEVE